VAFSPPRSAGSGGATWRGAIRTLDTYVASVLTAIRYPPLVRIELGPLSISPHAIGITLGFALGAWLFYPRMRARGIDEDWVAGALLRGALGAFVGARAAYVVNHLGDYGSPLEWFRLWEGGLSFLGGLTGALLAVAPYTRRAGYRFFQIMDAAAPGIALGIAVARIGDLVVADHLGGRTSLPFGFRCPDVADVGRTVGSPCPPGEVVHMTAAYDLIAVSVVLVVVLALEHRRRPEGTLAISAALAYALGRFSLDFLRADVRRLGLTGSQWFALAVAIVATAALVRRRRAAAIAPPAAVR